MSDLPQPALYLVATPIGNLADITLRALEVLKSVDLIAAEDTRHSRRLLDHYKISTPLIAYHEHNEIPQSQNLLRQLQDGRTIALISDAGMPLVSDPGFRLLRACIDNQIPYTVIPGPSAVITALAGAGFGNSRFFFGGFLPPKSGQRERELQNAILRPEPSLFFESPHRIAKSLNTLATLDPQHPVVLARELTKSYETYLHGTAEELAHIANAKPIKGEIVLIIQGQTRATKKSHH